MALPTIITIREHIAWSYANLARADAALEDGAMEYQRVHHIIRQRLYSGLVSGRMSMRSLYQDERLKMTMPQACYYCGSLDDLAVDHLIPRIKGGADESDNLIWACRCCRPSGASISTTSALPSTIVSRAIRRGRTRSVVATRRPRPVGRRRLRPPRPRRRSSVSRLGELLDKGDELIITGEAPVIDGGTLEDYEAKLAELAPWCDAMNATDNTAAHAHASNVAMAIAMQRVGVEPILQVVCRDKNRIAQQADIMGVALHGVENICCLTGDDVTAGDEPEARRVFDLDGPQLIRLANSLKEGRYLSGR